MNRREALSAGALLIASVSMLNAYDEKLIVNTKDMELQDPKNPTDFEYKHMPQIELKEKDEKGYTLVEITVGQEGIIHPSDANHWIYAIELYADDKLVAHADLEPVISRGFLSARVQLEGVKELKSITKCNLHGNYSASIAIEKEA